MTQKSKPNKAINVFEWEQAVIGGLLADGSHWPAVAALLSENDFSDNRHKLAFRALAMLAKSGRPFEKLFAMAALDDGVTALTPEGGLRSYLDQLALNFPSANVPAYAKEVRCHSLARAVDAAHERRASGAEILAIEAQLAALESGGGPDLVSRVVTSMAQMRERAAAEQTKFLLPWLPAGGAIVMPHGREGVGKSLFSAAVAGALLKGGRLMTWEVSSQARRILWIDGEMRRRDLLNHLTPFITRDVENRIDLISWADYKAETGEQFDLGQPAAMALLLEALDRRPDCDLVVLDNVINLFLDCEHNKADGPTGFKAKVRPLLMAIREREISTLMPHHSGKNGSYLGSVALGAFLDGVIALERPEDYEARDGARFTLNFQKFRGVPSGALAPFEAKLEKDDRGGPVWTVKTASEGAGQSTQRCEILDVLREHGPLSLIQLAQALTPGKTVAAKDNAYWKTNRLVQKLRDRGLVRTRSYDRAIEVVQPVSEVQPVQPVQPVQLMKIIEVAPELHPPPVQPLTHGKDCEKMQSCTVAPVAPPPPGENDDMEVLPV